MGALSKDVVKQIANRHIIDETSFDIFSFAEEIASLEREACAKVCEAYAMPDGTSITALILASVIRARGKHD